MSVSLGLFHVNTGTIRKFLYERHQQIAKEILKVIAKRVRSRGDDLIARFVEASRQVVASSMRDARGREWEEGRGEG